MATRVQQVAATLAAVCAIQMSQQLTLCAAVVVCRRQLCPESVPSLNFPPVQRTRGAPSFTFSFIFSLLKNNHRENPTREELAPKPPSTFQVQHGLVSSPEEIDTFALVSTLAHRTQPAHRGCILTDRGRKFAPRRLERGPSDECRMISVAFWSFRFELHSTTSSSTLTSLLNRKWT